MADRSRSLLKDIDKAYKKKDFKTFKSIKIKMLNTLKQQISDTLQPYSWLSLSSVEKWKMSMDFKSRLRLNNILSLAVL